MMKKMLPFLVTAAILLTLAACGGSPAQRSGDRSAPPTSSSQPETPSSSVSSQPAESSSETASQPTEPASPSQGEPASSPESQAPEDPAPPAPEEQPKDKALVVYFSHSGNTKSVADAIASQTGADTFRIEPVEAYTTDYNTLLDVARDEQSAQARPAISGSIDDLDQYSVIYLGYPNWWGDMPMILYTFLDTYDLSGKTIAPFVTSGGSGLSGTVGTIRSLEPDATVTDGLAIRDSAAANPDSAVESWLSGLGLTQ